MSEINIALVKELRNRTQAKLNDCKLALIESCGDLNGAIEVIKKKGQAESIKRAGTLATEGVVSALVSEDGKNGSIVEINVQTDFAAKNPDYLSFVQGVLQASLGAEEDIDLLALKLGEGSVQDAQATLVGILGENVSIRRRGFFNGYERIFAYNHPGGKVAVLISSLVPFESQLLSDLAMQIAAMNPIYVSPNDIPHAEIQKQTQFFLDQIIEEGKVPENKRDTVALGKMSKWFKEVCLLEQTSVFDSKKSVREIVNESGLIEENHNGGLYFIRFELGEGSLPQQ